MQPEHSLRRHLPWLLILGALAAAVTNIIATALAPDTGFVADTISDVAAGPFDWVQDLGLYLLAAGLLALAYIMWKRADGWLTWKFGALALLVMCASLILIAAVHEYGDGDAQNAVVHYNAVYAHGLSFAALLLLTLPRLRSGHSGWFALNLIVLALWLGGSFYFFNMGTKTDGLFERGLALLEGGWLLFFALQVAWQLGSRPVSYDRLPQMVTRITR